MHSGSINNQMSYLQLEAWRQQRRKVTTVKDKAPSPVAMSSLFPFPETTKQDHMTKSLIELPRTERFPFSSFVPHLNSKFTDDREANPHSHIALTKVVNHIPRPRPLLGACLAVPGLDNHV